MSGEGLPTLSSLQGAAPCRAARSLPCRWLSAKGSSRGRAPSRELLKKAAASGDPLSPSLAWLFPCPGERRWSTHHSIRMSLARRSSHRSPASKGVQGECLPPLMQQPPPLRKRLPFPFPPCRRPPLFPWLPWEATGHLCWAASGPDALFSSQVVHGKATVAPGGRALGAAEQCYLQSGQDLLVGQGSPARRAQGFQAQLSHGFPFWELDVRTVKNMAFCRGLPWEG